VAGNKSCTAKLKGAHMGTDPRILKRFNDLIELFGKLSREKPAATEELLQLVDHQRSGAIARASQIFDIPIAEATEIVNAAMYVKMAFDVATGARRSKAGLN